MQLKTCVPLVLAFTTAASLAAADTYTSKACAVSIDPPAGWKTEAKGDLVLFSDPKKEVGVLFVCSDKTDVKILMDGVGKIVDSIATDLKPEGKPKDFTVNGMSGVVFDGHAKSVQTKKDIAVSATIIKTNNSHAVVTVAVVDPATMKAHGPEVLKMFGSLKPVK
jgi:hypothetical protein